MAVSEKQKKWAREWDKDNMRTLSCRLRTYEADNFKAVCAMNNTTPAAVLKAAVRKYMRDNEEAFEVYMNSREE